jgi:hypothetical protein
MLSVFKLNVFKLSVILLSVFILSVALQNVIMLSVVILSIMASATLIHLANLLLTLKSKSMREFLQNFLGRNLRLQKTVHHFHSLNMRDSERN